MRQETKRCPHCRDTLPATTEYFQRDKHQPSGLFVYCKVCAGEKRRDLYWKEKWRAKAREATARARSGMNSRLLTPEEFESVRRYWWSVMQLPVGKYVPPDRAQDIRANVMRALEKTR